jgi:hypothetical protein
MIFQTLGSVFTHTHALHELSYLFEFSIFRKTICAKWNLNSHLYLCLVSEMLSDCVISWLYMRVLTLTWGNLISVNFPQLFWCFSVECPDGLVVRTEMEPTCPDRTWQIPDARCHHRRNGLFISSGRARPFCSFPRQRASERHQSTVRTGTPQRL